MPTKRKTNLQHRLFLTHKQPNFFALKNTRLKDIIQDPSLIIIQLIKSKSVKL